MSDNNPTRGQVVAAFDFDGTLSSADSFLPFLRQVAGRAGYWRRMALLLPLLLAFRAGLIGSTRAKTAVLRQFVRGMSRAQMESHARRFAAGHLPAMIRPEALARLRWHQAQGHRCVIVSASLEMYLLPWARSMGVDDVLATRLEVTDGRCSGRLAGANCRGMEKVRRLEAWLGARSDWTVYAYGDSGGDRELLAWADHSWYRTMPAEG